MSSETTYRTSVRSDGDVCECGCAPCASDSCGLECLEQPRFYCGQLLNDQDLTKLLNWTRDKLQLKRFIDGWGVVCGLEIRCDPTQAGQVLVSPGYAVDCCGKDIIICEETGFDLRGYCPVPYTTCEQPATNTGTDTPQYMTVDLYLRYDEQETAPRAAFYRSDCHDLRKCEPSRIKEHFELQARATELTSDPARIAAEDWLCRYRESMVRILGHFAGVEELDQDAFVARFLAWLESHPLRSFCFLRDLICEMSEIGQLQRMEFLLWLMQDARMNFFRCNCHVCNDDPGVPLARIILEAVEQDGRRECRVRAIDAYQPYRRPLARDCWPAPLGMINLGQLVWLRYEEACIHLNAMGVNDINKEPFSLPNNLDDLRAIIDGEAGYSTEFGCSAGSANLLAHCGQPVELLTLDPNASLIIPAALLPPGERVIGFHLERRNERGEATTERVRTQKKRATNKTRSTKK
jgi:hypothetical protein